MIRFLRALISNIATLTLALIVATLIWINASQVEEETGRLNLSIPITIVGIPENGILIRPDLTNLQTVQISYEGPLSIISQLTVEDFTATLDFSSLPYSEETAVPLQVKINNNPEDVNIVFQSSERVLALLEQSISRNIPIELDIRGSVARGHIQGTPLIDPEFITVSGPTSSVEQLSLIRLTIFLNNARETRVYSPQIIYYDQQGRVTSTRGLTTSTDEVLVTIPVNESAGFAEKFITVARIGEPAPGYRLLNITVEPDSIFLTGPPAQLAALTRVETEPINLTGLTSSIQMRVGLDLPPGIELDQDQEIFVFVEIAPRTDTASFRRDIEIFGLGPELEVSQIQPEEVRVIFFGPVLALEGLVDEDIRVTVDLFGLKEGKYSIEPDVAFPERGLELRSILPALITVEITRVQAITQTLTGTLSITETSSLPHSDVGEMTAVSPPNIPQLAFLTPFAYHSSWALPARREIL